MTLNATGCAWEQKQNRNHKIMKSDLTFESIISCWESRKCCVVRHFLSEYIVLTCSSHYQPTQPSYLHPRTLPHRAPGLAATSQAKSKRGNEAISLRFPLPITCLVSKYWIILHGSWRCDLFIHLLLIQFSTGMGTEVVFIFLQSSWALPGLQNEEITRHQVNKLFHPLQERFTLVSVHSAVTMPPPPPPQRGRVLSGVFLSYLCRPCCVSAWEMTLVMPAHPSLPLSLRKPASSSQSPTHTSHPPHPPPLFLFLIILWWFPLDVLFS